MKRTLRLARRAEGKTSPNPMVGAVLVKNGKKTGEGYHHFAGGPHAEIEALRSAGNNASGSHLYINLEPCCHTGRTPPCTDALIKARIKKVTCAMEDPNPLVSGKGIKVLRKAGIEVHTGLMRDEAEKLNMVYTKYITTGKPFVTLKWASALDGKTATDTGESQWITGEHARRYVHKIRAQSDAILVGLGTVKADDPELTIRHGYRRKRPFYRIIMDGTLEIPKSARILKPLDGYPTIIAAGTYSCMSCGAGYGSGVELLPCDTDDDGVNPVQLLEKLGKRQITSLFVEGGPHVHASFIKHGLVDRLLVFMAPRIIGGKKSASAVGDIDCHSLEDTPGFRIESMRKLGNDLLIELYPVK